MDSEGTGRLNAIEIYNGYRLYDKILDGLKSDPDMKYKVVEFELFNLSDPREDPDSDVVKIIENCDLDNNNHMDYWDFLVGTVDAQDLNKFYGYCEQAYELFFKEYGFISNNEFIDKLCENEAMKSDQLNAFVEYVDVDGSAEISYRELVQVLIEQLGLQNVTCCHAVIKRMRNDFDIEYSDSEDSSTYDK